MECAYCGKKIGVLRKLKHAEFCSVAHQKAYMKKQEALALDFLMENKKRPTHKVSQVPPVETALAVPEPPKSQPLPSAAGCRRARGTRQTGGFGRAHRSTPKFAAAARFAGG